MFPSISIKYLTFNKVYALQSSLLSAEVKFVEAQILITWFQCLGWTGAGCCDHSEDGKKQTQGGGIE